VTKFLVPVYFEEVSLAVGQSTSFFRESSFVENYFWRGKI